MPMHAETAMSPVLAGGREENWSTAAEGAPGSPLEQLLQEQLMQMSVDMFFGDAAGPRATGEAGAARPSSLGLLQIAEAVRNDLWDNRKAEIKALFAPEPTEKKEEVCSHTWSPTPWVCRCCITELRWLPGSGPTMGPVQP